MNSPEAKHVLTKDGSSTLYVEQFDEHYHSIHGAIQESLHVFIANGLEYIKQNNNDIAILEIGLGTGLNVLLTYLHAEDFEISYTGIEAYPLNWDQAQILNYCQLLGDKLSEDTFRNIHTVPWGQVHSLSPQFSLMKIHHRLQEVQLEGRFHLVYFDAFAPSAQPELWSEEMFKKLYLCCKEGGVLVTYSAKGAVRRAMISAGFEVQKLPGPPGKREMLRAIKR